MMQRVQPDDSAERSRGRGGGGGGGLSGGERMEEEADAAQPPHSNHGRSGSGSSSSSSCSSSSSSGGNHRRSSCGGDSGSNESGSSSSSRRRCHGKQADTSFTSQGSAGQPILAEFKPVRIMVLGVDETTTDIAVDEVCSVCFDMLTPTNAIIIPDCKHTFCRECVSGHCDNAIATNCIPAPCLAVDCKQIIPQSLIEQLISEDKFARYRRFLLLRSNRDVRACPYCEKLQTHNPANGSEITCKNCSQTFCFYHSNAHNGRSCAEYISNPPPEERASLDLIKETCKPCPTCGAAIEHAGGCPHIDCHTCGVDFCWTCGQAGLTGTVIRTCPRCQAEYIVHSYLPLFWLVYLLTLPLQLGFAVLMLALFPLVNLLALLCRCRCKLIWTFRTLAILMFGPTMLIYEMTVEIMQWPRCCGNCEECIA